MQTTVEFRISLSNQTTHVKNGEEGVRVEMMAVQSSNGFLPKELDGKSASAFSTFKSNFDCWNTENQLSTFSNTDNCYFREIVKMGVTAVPFIYEELKKGPTSLVYALDEIFGHPIKYDEFVPLKQSCDAWITILNQIEL